MNRLKILGLGILLMGSTQLFAQEQSTTASSNPSARPIPETDMMYRKTVWRTIDLREKQNKPFLSNNLEITKLIIEAVKRGELPIYSDDKLTTTLTQEEFSKKLVIESEAAPVDPTLNAGGDDWGDAGAAATGPVGPAEYFPKDLYTLQMKEDAIFDKKRSRMYHDIKSITLIIPAEKNAKQIDDPIATFKYSDLVKVFKDHPTEAVWFNPQNDARHLNFADAFDLRLFSSYITKVSNPGDLNLNDIYGGAQQGILAAQTTAEQMIEYEYNLWSF